MKSTLERIWFQPSTPFIILVLVGTVMYFGIYPLFQKAILPNPVGNPSLTITPSPAAGVLGAQAGTEAEILEKLGKLILLPGDEKPNIIPIPDVTKYRSEPFFKNARDGNVLLVYNKNKKAILYDPQLNQIIDVAPINPPEEQQQTQQDPLAQEPLAPSPVASASSSPTPSTTVTVTPTP